MFGWTDHLGHLSSGGTFANLEGLWIAGQLPPGKRIVASNKPTIRIRISAVLGLPFTSVPADCAAGWTWRRSESALREGDVGTVVVTLGTTATGAVDPLIGCSRCAMYPFRSTSMRPTADIHSCLQAWRGGRAPFCVAQADSIVVDPHKHGLQPYGCGCILFRDPAVGRFYKHDSPYTYFTSHDLHLGEISLECSRAGASAVALWATQQLLPLISER